MGYGVGTLAYPTGIQNELRALHSVFISQCDRTRSKIDRRTGVTMKVSITPVFAVLSSRCPVEAVETADSETQYEAEPQQQQKQQQPKVVHRLDASDESLDQAFVDGTFGFFENRVCAASLVNDQDIWYQRCSTHVGAMLCDVRTSPSNWNMVSLPFHLSQIRSLGNAVRATGDTVAGLTGGGIKTLGRPHIYQPHDSTCNTGNLHL